MTFISNLRDELKKKSQRSTFTSDDTSNELHEVYLREKINQIEEEEKEQRLHRTAENKSYKRYMIDLLSKLELKELEVVIKSDPIAERIYDYNSYTILGNRLTPLLSSFNLTQKQIQDLIDKIVSELEKSRRVRKPTQLVIDKLVSGLEDLSLRLTRKPEPGIMDKIVSELKNLELALV